MVVDDYGIVGFTQKEIVDYLKVNPNFEIDNLFLVDGEQYQKAINDTFISMPEISLWKENDHEIPLEEYHSELQNHWFMPDEYVYLDITKYIQSLCKTEQEISRVNTELKLYEKFNLLPLLRYLKYLRDIANQNKIVWGVGRGSSCCSYCLYLMRIHRVNSLEYDLDIKDFLR